MTYDSPFQYLLFELYQHSPSFVLVLMTVAAIGTGLLALGLAERFKLPAIVFLLGLGILVGPEGIGLVQPSWYGAGLRAIISLSVAIIVFEGGLAIDVRQLKRASRPVLGLLTITPLLTFGAMTAVAIHVAGIPWKVAALYGAIVSVTGPTVISPILKRIPLGRRLRTTLNAESVFVDAVGVLLAAAVFNYITAAHQGWVEGMTTMLANLGIGAMVGVLVCGVVRLLLRWATSLSGELVRLLVLLTPLVAYSLAELYVHEAGIAAVAVAGLYLGAGELPYAEAVKRFKEDLTSLLLSLVFVLLAASLKLEYLSRIGWGGPAVVALLMFVVRPLAVFAGTLGTRMPWRERVFVAWMGPRGIVAASMATFFALELAGWGISSGHYLIGLVFWTIIITVLVQGGLAGKMAEWLGVIPAYTMVLGGDSLSLTLAKQLAATGESVVYVARDKDHVATASEAGLKAVLADAEHPEDLAKAGIAHAHCAVVATQSDKSNLLISQLIRSEYPGIRLVARLSDRKSISAFNDLGIETLDSESAFSTALVNLVSRPHVHALMTPGTTGERVVEVAMTNADLVGRQLKELDLPEGVLIMLIKGPAGYGIPSGRTRLQAHDRLIVVGKETAVNEAINYLT